jgi:hypothetical protein
MKPIDVDELFELNPDYEVVSFDDGIIMIDNWYKNYDQIIETLEKQTPVLFNPDSYDGIKSENGKDYYDCRLVLTNTFNNKKYLSTFNEIKKILNDVMLVEELSFDRQALVFNYWKNIKIPNQNEQASPHTDYHYDIACIIYLDKICSGGTMLYGLDSGPTNGAGLQDITNAKQTYNIIPQKLIQSKPNRLVIYPGQQWHGAYIEDHSMYVDEWRINQVHFMNVVNNKNNNKE